MSWKRILIGGCAAALISMPVMAADGSGTPTNPVGTDQTEPAANPGPPRQLGTPAPESRPEATVRKVPVEGELVGKPVFTESGKKVATVDHVVVDPSSNQRMVVLAYGGFLGFGERKVAVPYDRIRVTQDIPTIDLSREALDEMPEFEPRPE